MRGPAAGGPAAAGFIAGGVAYDDPLLQDPWVLKKREMIQAQRRGQAAQRGPKPPMPWWELDTLRDDGPISVAYDMRTHVVATRGERPAPNTEQYIRRKASRQLEHELMRLPPVSCDVCGYVQASVEATDAQEQTAVEQEHLNLAHDEHRLVYMCISGWALMMWRTEADYNAGVHGERDAPRPMAWWDLRKAHDVAVESGDMEIDFCPHRIAVLTRSGVIFFRLMYAEDVQVWYSALRRVIHDAMIGFIRSRDNLHHQEKRWPAAIGISRALQNRSEIGSRAMAILFHCYDIDYNCYLETGELMVLIQEIEAAIRHAEGRGEALDRSAAIESSRTVIPEEELFERAMQFRSRCDADGNGFVGKDEFIRFGQAALEEALGYSQAWGDYGFHGGKIAGTNDDVCAVM